MTTNNINQAPENTLNTEDNWAKIRDIVGLIIDKAKAKGATSAEAAANIDAGLAISVRNNQVETVEFNRDKSIAVTVYKGHCKGSVSTTDTSEQSIEQAVERACQIASYTEQDPFAGLADKQLMATDLRNLDLYHPIAIDAQDAIAYAMQAESAGMASQSLIKNSDGASFSTIQRYSVYGNSHGFVGEYPSSRNSLSCCLIAQQDSSMERDYHYTTARDFNDLENFSKVGEQSANKAVAKLGAIKIKTTMAPVLYIPEVARGIMASFLSAISGGSLYRRASFLVDSLGKQIFPSFLSLTEYPHIPKGLGSTMFDGEGVATKQKHLVKDGIIQSYVLSSYSARKLGMQTTANAGGVHNLTISGQSFSFDELIKKMDKGLIVTETMGQGINIVTGDYSKGASGFWVENGEIKHPVSEVTIAGNFKDMFANLVAIGSDLDRRSNIICGSLLMDKMMIAGA